MSKYILRTNKDPKAAPTIISKGKAGGNQLDLYVTNENPPIHLYFGKGNKILTISISANIINLENVNLIGFPEGWTNKKITLPDPQKKLRDQYYEIEITPPNKKDKGILLPKGTPVELLTLTNIQPTAIAPGRIMLSYAFSPFPMKHASCQINVDAVKKPALKDLIGEGNPLSLDFKVNGGSNQDPINVIPAAHLSPSSYDTNPSFNNRLHFTLTFQSSNLPDGQSTQLVNKWDDNNKPTIRVYFPYANSGNDLGAAIDLTDVQDSKTSNGEINPNYNPITTAWNIRGSLNEKNPIPDNDIWTISQDSKSPIPTWIIQPKSGNTALFSNQIDRAKGMYGPLLDFYLDHIYTVLPIGDEHPETLIYVQWEHFPGYNAGLRVLSLSKKELSFPKVNAFSAILKRDQENNPFLEFNWDVQHVNNIRVLGTYTKIELFNSNFPTGTRKVPVSATDNNYLLSNYTLEIINNKNGLKSSSALSVIFEEDQTVITSPAKIWTMAINPKSDSIYYTADFDKLYHFNVQSLNKPIEILFDRSGLLNGIYQIVLLTISNRLYFSLRAVKGKIYYLDLSNTGPNIKPFEVANSGPFNENFKMGLTPDEKFIFVANPEPSNYTSVAYFSTTGSIPQEYPTISLDSNPNAICFAEETKTCFIALDNKKVTFFKYDHLPPKEPTEFSVPGIPDKIKVTADGKRGLITYKQREDYILSVFSAGTSPKIIRTIEKSPVQTDIFLSSDSATAFLIHSGYSKIDYINTMDIPVNQIPSIKVKGRPESLVFTSDGSRGFVSSYHSDKSNYTITVLTPKLIIQTPIITAFSGKLTVTPKGWQIIFNWHAAFTNYCTITGSHQLQEPSKTSYLHKITLENPLQGPYILTAYGLDGITTTQAVVNTEDQYPGDPTIKSFNGKIEEEEGKFNLILTWDTSNALCCTINDDPTVLSANSSNLSPYRQPITIKQPLQESYTLIVYDLHGVERGIKTLHRDQILKGKTAINSFNGKIEEEQGKFTLTLTWDTSNALYYRLEGSHQLQESSKTSYVQEITRVNTLQDQYLLIAYGLDGITTTQAIVKTEHLYQDDVTIKSFSGQIKEEQGKFTLSLTWDTSNAFYCTIDGDPTILPISSSKLKSPYRQPITIKQPLQKFYELTAYDLYGRKRVQKSLLKDWLYDGTIIKFFTGAIQEKNGKKRLAFTWDVTNAFYCTLLNEDDHLPLSSDEPLMVPLSSISDKVFTLNAYGLDGGIVKKQWILKETIDSFTITAQKKDGKTILVFNWATTNIRSCQLASGEPNTKQKILVENLLPTGSYTQELSSDHSLEDHYTLTATAYDGSVLHEIRNPQIDVTINSFSGTLEPSTKTLTLNWNVSGASWCTLNSYSKTRLPISTQAKPYQTPITLQNPLEKKYTLYAYDAFGKVKATKEVVIDVPEKNIIINSFSGIYSEDQQASHPPTKILTLKWDASGAAWCTLNWSIAPLPISTLTKPYQMTISAQRPLFAKNVLLAYNIYGEEVAKAIITVGLTRVLPFENSNDYSYANMVISADAQWGFVYDGLKYGTQSDKVSYFHSWSNRLGEVHSIQVNDTSKKHKNPKFIAFSPDAKKGFICNWGDQTITLFDIEQLSDAKAQKIRPKLSFKTGCPDGNFKIAQSAYSNWSLIYASEFLAFFETEKASASTTPTSIPTPIGTNYGAALALGPFGDKVFYSVKGGIGWFKVDFPNVPTPKDINTIPIESGSVIVDIAAITPLRWIYCCDSVGGKVYYFNDSNPPDHKTIPKSFELDKGFMPHKIVFSKATPGGQLAYLVGNTEQDTRVYYFDPNTPPVKTPPYFLIDKNGTLPEEMRDIVLSPDGTYALLGNNAENKLYKLMPPTTEIKGDV